MVEKKQEDWKEDPRVIELNGILGGSSIDGYNLSREPVGVGNFSAGYKASAKGKQSIFVKVPLEMMFHDPFRAVGKAHSRLKGTHPSIACFLDLKDLPGPMGPLPAIITEFCDFPSVKTRMDEDKPFSVKESIMIAGKVLDGLEFAHDQNVYHGDVSPVNLRVGDGVVKLTDWFHQVFISFFPQEAKPVTPYGGDYGPSAKFLFRKEVAPTLLMEQVIKEPNAFTDIYMLSRTLNYMLTENVGDRLMGRLLIDEADSEVISRMQDLLDMGKPDLTEKQWANMSTLRGARGYHSVAEMRADLEKVIGVDYDSVQKVYTALQQAISKGQKKDGTNSNLSTVEQLYYQLTMYPQHDDRVNQTVDQANQAIISGIGDPFYESVDGACQLVEGEVQKGKRTEEDFWKWHTQTTGPLKTYLNQIKETQHLDGILKGYRGPNNGEALY